MSDYFGKDTPKLGFGLMRLPKKDDVTDIEQVKAMVDLFMENGFTYFDTAYVYGTSEEDTRKALVERYPRESYTLASKMNGHATDCPDEASVKAQFETSLKRTGAGYFDYYLLHALMRDNYHEYDDYHIWDYVKRLKDAGNIRHMGFSFHGDPALLDELLSAHPEVDFVQLQINYADWDNPKVTSRANYEMARKHGKSIVVMEPVKGGNLANPPKEVTDLFHAYDPDASPASWAIRFVASLDGIITVLSGMSTIDQMKDNISYMKAFKPLNEREQEIIKAAQKIIGKSQTIACTACHYCTPGCPKGIHIPEIFAAANIQIGHGDATKSLEEYQKVVGLTNHASDCIQCKQCEGVCPQHLEITDLLKQCANLFGELR